MKKLFFLLLFLSISHLNATSGNTERFKRESVGCFRHIVTHPHSNVHYNKKDGLPPEDNPNIIVIKESGPQLVYVYTLDAMPSQKASGIVEEIFGKKRTILPPMKLRSFRELD